MPNWSEKIFIIKKIENTVPWTYVIKDLNGEEIIGTFYENELQGTSQQEFRIEKVLKKKGDKLYGRVMIILLIVGLIKKTLYKMSQYFPKPYVEMLMLQLIYLIMQQRMILKILFM